MAEDYAGISGREWARYDRDIDKMDSERLRRSLKREGRIRAAAEAEIKKLGGHGGWISDYLPVAEADNG